MGIISTTLHDYLSSLYDKQLQEQKDQASMERQIEANDARLELERQQHLNKIDQIGAQKFADEVIENKKFDHNKQLQKSEQAWKKREAEDSRKHQSAENKLDRANRLAVANTKGNYQGATQLMKSSTDLVRAGMGAAGLIRLLGR